MSIRLSAAEFKKQFGGVAVGTVKDCGKPGIRLPKPVKMSKVEDEYGRILITEFACHVLKYEAITLRLAGGNYTPDWTVWLGDRLLLCVECKGAYRLGSAGRSHMAFKAAIAAWPHIKFRFAQKSKDGWQTVEAN